MSKHFNSSTLILLSGGKSSRMKEPKGLLKYHNSFWILSQIERFTGTEVVIGLGFDANMYFEAIPWLEEAMLNSYVYKKKKVRAILNQNPELGAFSTLQSALKVLDTKLFNTIFILPIDVPLINNQEQRKLLFTENQIVIPSFQNKKGHPVKLSSTFWKPLLELNPKDESARLDLQIKKRNASEISIVEISDASCILNLNTPKDWQAFTSD